ncbi:MAG: aminoglycoside phosphotransferase family protein [Phycisphaerales bacterium]|nr:aminoglycoside phosphotransferase family protein [Phycisphaerales bacterium]
MLNTPESTPEQAPAAPRVGVAATPSGVQRPIPTGDTHDLAVGLEPLLHEACGERLGPIQWFQSSWQRGGAATGFARWTFADGAAADVIVKLPVGPREYSWTVRLGAVEHEAWGDAQSCGLPVPRVVAAGEMIGGYDLGWLVIERLNGPALNQEICEATVQELLHTAAEFHRAAGTVRPVEGRGEVRDWRELIARSREALDYVTMPEIQRWREHLHRLERCLKRVLGTWDDRPRDTWCHGDLHPGNAMRRADGDGSSGRCVLLDLAFVHPGHWVEDAVYVERQFWAHPEVLGKTKPVAELARRRRDLGLEHNGDHGTLAAARRVLMAGCAPAWWETEGSRAYAQGALDILDRYLHIFGK